MGVSLSGLVNAKQVDIHDLNGKMIAIDAYNVMYQFLTTIRDRFTGEPLRDSHGRVTSHLSGLFYRTSKLIDSGIKVAYVFDGNPPDFKRQTVEQRMGIREEAKVKWKEAVEKGDMEGIRRYSQAAARLTKDMVTEAKRLLDYMGVSWIQAPSEGEAQVAHLVKKGRVWACGSQDWDSLLFGAPKLVRNLTITGRRKVAGKEKYMTVKPEIVELDSVLSELGISHDQLIMLGILVGTDYNPGGIKGIGPKTALNTVKGKNSVEDVFSDVDWDFKVTPEEIFDFFKNPPVDEAEMEKKELQPEKLIGMLCKERSFSKERIGSVVDKLAEGKEKEKQSDLGRFW